MTSMYPIITRGYRSIDVQFGERSERDQRIQIDVVIDYDFSGDVTGIEILDLKHQAGESSIDIIQELVPAGGAVLRCGFDEENDAFYLKVSGSRSAEQRELLGTLTLDEKSRIVGIQLGEADDTKTLSPSETPDPEIPDPG